jgi:undecaprenyl-diphosphatase
MLSVFPAGGLSVDQMSTFDHIMKAVSFVSSSPANLFWAMLISLAFIYRHHFREAGTLFFGYAFGSSLVPALKLLFARERPPLPDQVLGYSFPSGHTLSSTVLVGLLLWLGMRRNPARKILYSALAVIWLAAVGTSRIYLGAHWPSDVIAGFSFGAVFVTLWLVMTHRWTKPEQH